MAMVLRGACGRCGRPYDGLAYDCTTGDLLCPGCVAARLNSLSALPSYPDYPSADFTPRYVPVRPAPAAGIDAGWAVVAGFTGVCLGLVALKLLGVL